LHGSCGLTRRPKRVVLESILTGPVQRPPGKEWTYLPVVGSRREASNQ
jgi:hypothetical protein